MNITKIIDKLKTINNIIKNSIMYFVYYNIPINKNFVYIESRDGDDIADNIVCLIKELIKNDYGKLSIFLYVKRKIIKNKRYILKNSGITGVYIIPFRKVASIFISISKYIITDSSLDPSYVKRDGQIVISTWHGTPFKVMGRYNRAEKHSLGGVQQTFLKSDYLIFANKYMKDILIRDYMLENICQAKCLLSGYPRNSIFFDSTEYLKQRKKICLSGQIITYMPTFRGTVFEKKNEKQAKTIYEYLSYIDNVLQENQTFLVKLHNFNDISIDFSYFKKVKKFPSNYATYDVLAATDILITDYSSVFFDFANTGRKIILFTYDKKEYFEDRGVYFSFDSLPFKNVDTVEKLMDEINNQENIDYSDFFKKFGYYDKEGCTHDICQHIFKGIPSCNEEVIPYNGKKNILIYAGSMKKKRYHLCTA